MRLTLIPLALGLLACSDPEPDHAELDRLRHELAESQARQERLEAEKQALEAELQPLREAEQRRAEEAAARDALAICQRLQDQNVATDCATYHPQGAAWVGAADAAEFHDPDRHAKVGSVLVYDDTHKFDTTIDQVLDFRRLGRLISFPHVYADRDRLLIVRLDSGYTTAHADRIASILAVERPTRQMLQQSADEDTTADNAPATREDPEPVPGSHGDRHLPL